MKIKNIVTVLLVIIILASCAPAAKVVPTETAIPTLTFTSIPSTPTITPTSTPENIADAKDLSKWIDDYVHAFGGKVVVYGIEMDSSQLTDDVRNNSDKYVQVKQIDGNEILFLSVNDTPLAFRQKGNWQSITIKTLADMQGLIIGSEPRITPNFYEQLNQVTAGVYWSVIEPQQGIYDFGGFDKEVVDAKEHNMTVRGHALVFPTSSSWTIPQWLKDGNFSKDDLQRILVEHITKVVQHGKEMGVTEWVVVNEPYLQGSSRTDDIFYKAFGGYEYIEIAFQAARNADPNALLIYNDTDNHSSSGMTTGLTRKIVQMLREKNLIDAVGVQAHIGDWVPIYDKKDIENTLKSYELPVIITEFDYNLTGIGGTEQERYEKQAKIYSDFLATALDVNCKEFTFWGISDSKTWLLDIGITDGAPAIFDKSYRPKMAYYAVLAVLFNKIQ
ncbi:MAG: endo-1,4-beta-xylanase [Chloroflexi bacterium]|nr:endo-1,4-beta-xylanase [Chloroflexota bacterium]